MKETITRTNAEIESFWLVNVNQSQLVIAQPKAQRKRSGARRIQKSNNSEHFHNKS